jgi:hypothetical protein
MVVVETKKITQITLYNYLLKNYPAKIKRYILRNLIAKKQYNPDLTFIIKSNKYHCNVTYLWFDLFSPQDITLFVDVSWLKKLFWCLRLVDIIVVGIDEKKALNEFYLEFSNRKIDIIFEFLLYIEKIFNNDYSFILEKIKELKNFLDLNNYFMVGFRFKHGYVEEVDFSFNITKSYFDKLAKNKKFYPLFKVLQGKPFRGEQSYIVTSPHKVLTKIGWMINKPAVRYLCLLEKNFCNIKWKNSLIEKTKAYFYCEYASHIYLSWLSYIYDDKSLSQINLHVSPRI